MTAKLVAVLVLFAHHAHATVYGFTRHMFELDRRVVNLKFVSQPIIDGA